MSVLGGRGSISQHRFICQVLCTGIQGICALLPKGGPSAKVCSTTKFGVLVFKASLLWYHWGRGSISQSRFICQVWYTGIQGICALVPGGSIGQSRFICQVLCTGIQGISALVLGGSIGQRRFICQVLFTGIQGISALVPLVGGGPSGNVGSSAKFCVLVFKASLLWYHWGEGGPSANVGSSAKFCVLVFKASLLCYMGGPSANIGSSAKFCVLVFKASVVWYHWGRGSISQSRFICQVLCTGIQGISALLAGEVHWPK